MTLPPRVFISYSHDSPVHKQWVLKLASDLRTNGVDAVLDQWDLSPGDDIPSFMEHGLAAADRVVVICSSKYVEKANAGTGGVGYEKMIVTAELIGNLGTKKFVPIIRSAGSPPVPTFLGYRLHIDFEEDAKYPTALEVLLRELLGASDPGKPAIGANPFAGHGQEAERQADEGTNAAVVGASLVAPLVLATVASVLPTRSGTDSNSTIAALKRLMADGAHVIKLQDLILPIATEARERLVQTEALNLSVHPTKEELVRRVTLWNDALALLEQVLAVASHWSNTEQARVIAKALSRLVVVQQPSGTVYQMWERVVRYPALRASYACGIGAQSSESYGVLRRLLVETRCPPRAGQSEIPLLLALHEGAGFAQNYWKWLPGMDKRHMPVSDYLEESMRPCFQQLLESDEEILEQFDRYELFQALVFADIEGAERERFWAPLGSFIWRRSELVSRVREEIETAMPTWAPLQAGFFSGSKTRALEMLSRLEEHIALVRGQLGIW